MAEGSEKQEPHYTPIGWLRSRIGPGGCGPPVSLLAQRLHQVDAARPEGRRQTRGKRDRAKGDRRRSRAQADRMASRRRAAFSAAGRPSPRRSHRHHVPTATILEPSPTTSWTIWLRLGADGFPDRHLFDPRVDRQRKNAIQPDDGQYGRDDGKPDEETHGKRACGHRLAADLGHARHPLDRGSRVDPAELATHERRNAAGSPAVRTTRCFENAPDCQNGR